MAISVVFTYGILLTAVISLWINIKLFDKIPMWILLLSLSFLSAIISDYATFISLIYALVFGTTVYLYYKTDNVIYFIFTVVLSILLTLHLPVLGFDNYQFLNAVRVSENSAPFSLYFNLDKTLIGLFVIGFSFSKTKVDFVKSTTSGSQRGMSTAKPFLFDGGGAFQPRLVGKKLIFYLLLMSFVLLTIAVWFGYSRFEPKVPSFTIVWVLVNLFFVCTAEEALFRKLIHDKIDAFFSFKNSYILSIVLSSLLFGLAHYKGGIPYIALSTIAGLFYGHIYHKTNSIESSILLHFSFNLVHILLFTYPSLDL